MENDDKVSGQLFGKLNEGIPAKVQEIMQKLHFAAQEHIEDGKDVPPTLLVFKNLNKDPVSIVSVRDLLELPHGKDLLQMAMEKLIKADDIAAVVFMVEAWVVELSAKEYTREQALEITPSEHHDKREAVIFTFLTKTRQFLGKANVLRDPAKLLELNIIAAEEGELEGRLVRPAGETPKLH